MSDHIAITFILPARNEAPALKTLLPSLKARWGAHEIIVVDDGSEDDTRAVCEAAGVLVISHPYPKGNGAALKTAVRAAHGDIFVFLDADGQHTIESIEQLLCAYQEGQFDMVVGSRSRKDQASTIRYIGNWLYNRIASYVVGRPVADLTSGCRVINAHYYRQFLHLLPNGFSAPSTITLAFFRTGLSVQYIPIAVSPRIGKSHIHPLRDGARFFIILYKLTTLYAPLKLFLPLSLVHLVLAILFGLWVSTLAGILLGVASILIFLIGLIAEQITALLYQPRKEK